MVLLLDGDIIVWKSACSAEHAVYHFDEYTFRYKREVLNYIEANHDDPESLHNYVRADKVVMPLTKAISAANEILKGALMATGADKYEVYLSGKNNFRLSIPYPVTYKGNRKGDKPVYFNAVREHLKSEWGAKEVEGIETDDQLSIRSRLLGKEAIIASIDKDLRQVPGKHYNLDTKEITIINELDGYRNLGIQLLCGDDADNIIGCKGIGPKTAEKMLGKLQTKDEIYEAVKQQYQKSFGNDWTKMFESNFQLLMLRVI